MGTQSSTESVGGDDSDNDVDDMLKVNQPTGYKQSTYDVLKTFSLPMIQVIPVDVDKPIGPSQACHNRVLDQIAQSH